jgi:pyruvate formate lyase activating enzyme
MSKPLVFDIKRYAINDGPGIRIAVFLKGCNLNCAWCHNPESISDEAERMYSSSRCIRCGTCVAACPEKAITLTPEGIITDMALCKMHGKCAGVCPTKAIEISGREISVAEIMQEIEKERPFFDQSGGGVTFSGGEPLLHHKFLIRLLEECGKRRIHRAVDTAGFIGTDIILNVAEHTDLFLYDLKFMDPEKHRKWTGVTNEKILENLKALSATRAKIIIRIPLIGGVNDDAENIETTARFVAGLSGVKKEVNLLPYHKIAQTKYQKLGRQEDFLLLEEPSKEVQLQAISIFQKYGLMATIGG